MTDWDRRIDRFCDRLIDYLGKAVAIVMAVMFALAAIWPGTLVIQGLPIRNEFAVRGLAAGVSVLAAFFYWGHENLSRQVRRAKQARREGRPNA